MRLTASATRPSRAAPRCGPTPQAFAARTISPEPRGGYPEAVHRETPRRRLFDGYLADLLARDAKQVADIERATDMRRLIALLVAFARPPFRSRGGSDRRRRHRLRGHRT